ncbi:hypothetical protein ACJX0J_030324, partial [Zea mays]
MIIMGFMELIRRESFDVIYCFVMHQDIVCCYSRLGLDKPIYTGDLVKRTAIVNLFILEVPRMMLVKIAIFYAKHPCHISDTCTPNIISNGDKERLLDDGYLIMLLTMHKYG